MGGAAYLVMAASTGVSWVTALVSSFSKSSNILLISSNTSTSWSDQLVACDFGRDRRPSILFAIYLTRFDFGAMLKNYLRW